MANAPCDFLAAQWLHGCIGVFPPRVAMTIRIQVFRDDRAADHRDNASASSNVSLIATQAKTMNTA
jgi:hypothetical protein